jgi:microcystin-dependent protein
MADPFVAEIRIFPFNFAPKGWAWCDGQLLPLSDLQGSAPMHPGQGPGLSLHDLGETGGSETVSLLQSEIPAHPHSMSAAAQDPATAKLISNQASFSLSQGGGIYQDTQNAQLAPEATSPEGGDQPHNNMQPYLTLYFNIALQGVFPPRS